MAKQLAELLKLLPEFSLAGRTDTDIEIETITYDSRNVDKGALFICLPGTHSDGHDYVEQASQKGAVAVLVEREVALPPGLIGVKVPNTRQAMQLIAPCFFDYPGRALRMIGVTGTNGKTTTTYLIKSIFENAGYKVGLIGTIQTIIGTEILPVRNTTPDVIELQQTLARMRDAGLDYVVMEVSSHALALGRVAGCEYDVGIFTNLTRDHLDFHHTFEEYLAAKMKLFDMLADTNNRKQGKTAVINRDDPAFPEINTHLNCPVITYGMKGEASLRALNTEIKASGVYFDVKGQVELSLSLKITGIFNVYNVLGAIGAALAEKIEPAAIKSALENFTSVPGRFELVAEGQPFAVIVDYAHTPDGLENILRTAKEFTTGRLITVFGCGGDRDRTKRPIMGKLAAEYGDIVIATSDNPRSEEPAAILAEIETGIREGLSGDKTYESYINRREAIERAITMAKSGDTVIIAGKGHETYQILKDKTIPFDDREVAREILRGLR